MENIQKLLCEMQVNFVLVKIQGKTHEAVISLETIQVLRSAHGIICRYNWIADFDTIIMFVHKIT